jgi:hypothetical protein
MNKETMWALLLQNNPRLTEDPHFTPDSARRFFDMVWNTAYGVGCKDMTERQEEITGCPCSSAEQSQEDEEDEFIQLLLKVVESIEKLNADESPKKKKKHGPGAQ